MPRELSGWGFIFDMRTGALVSRATVVAAPLAPGLGLFERADDLNIESEQWDAGTRRIVPFTNIDKASRIAAAADAMLVEAKSIDPSIKLRGE